MLVFKKELMKLRISEVGLSYEWTDEIEEIANDLDGMEANPRNWMAVVNEEPVMWVVGRSGKGRYVNADDCIEDWVEIVDWKKGGARSEV